MGPVPEISHTSNAEFMSGPLPSNPWAQGDANDGEEGVESIQFYAKGE